MPHAWRARIAGATRFTLGAADYGKRTYVRLPCTAWNLGGRPSCTPTSMPSTRPSSSCWTPPYGTGPSRSAAVWSWPHRMKPGAMASAVACQGGRLASSVEISCSSAATSSATNSLAMMWCPSSLTSLLESSGSPSTRPSLTWREPPDFSGHQTRSRRPSAERAPRNWSASVDWRGPHQTSRQGRVTGGQTRRSGNGGARGRERLSRTPADRAHLGRRSHHRTSSPQRRDLYHWTTGQDRQSDSGKTARSGRRDETCRPLRQRRSTSSGDARSVRSRWAPRPRSGAGRPRRS